MVRVWLFAFYSRPTVLNRRHGYTIAMMMMSMAMGAGALAEVGAWLDTYGANRVQRRSFRTNVTVIGHSNVGSQVDFCTQLSATKSTALGNVTLYPFNPSEWEPARCNPTLPDCMVRGTDDNGKGGVAWEWVDCVDDEGQDRISPEPTL